MNQKKSLSTIVVTIGLALIGLGQFVYGSYLFCAGFVNIYNDIPWGTAQFILSWYALAFTFWEISETKKYWNEHK